MNNLLQDLRFALRQMLRSPGFALTAVITLALGIAANVIVFGVLDSLILRPLDVPQSEQVWQLGTTVLAYPVFSYPETRDIRDGNSVFSAVAGYVIQAFGVESGGNTSVMWGMEAGGQYFDVLGIKPALGRLLQRSDDDHPGASNAVVISWGSWKGKFGGDPNIVGKVVRINKQQYTIVGVTPETFHGTEKFFHVDMYVPLVNQASLEGTNWLEERHGRRVFLIARVKDGVTLPQVQADLDTIAARERKQYPVQEEALGLKLSRPGLIGDYIDKPARAFLAGVMVLGGIVLLAACANLGSLFAARTADRSREIAIRMAVGSSRWRILRQLLVEALAISILGGLCACGLAWTALTGMAQWHPSTDYPIQFDVTPQPSLIVVSFLIAVFSGAVFGAMPLLQIFKTDPNEVIKSGSQTSAGKRWALRDVLLAAQIALCCVTVTAAFVALRGMTKAMSSDLGFQPRNAILTRFDLSQAGYAGDAADQMQRRILERVSQLPGVKAAGYGNTTPLSNPSTTNVFAQQTTEFKDSTKAFDTFIYDVSPGYFAAADTPLLAGRDVSFADTKKTPLVAVVNHKFAEKLFHTDPRNASSDREAVGRFFKNSHGQLVQIVGIVGDGKYFYLSEHPSAALFYPITQTGDAGIDLIVRGQDDAAELAPAVRRVIRELDSSIPIQVSESWTSAIAFAFFPAQVATAALSLFGAFGLLLSVAGTFGLASYTVSKRLRELSIRVALGAQGKQVLAAALGRMLVLLASGSAVGIVLGVAASKLLSAVVYHASAQDPLVIAAVVTTMALTGVLSVAGPVRRALNLDPAVLLREQ
jgi:predicted permease